MLIFAIVLQHQLYFLGCRGTSWQATAMRSAGISSQAAAWGFKGGGGGGARARLLNVQPSTWTVKHSYAATCPRPGLAEVGAGKYET